MSSFEELLRNLKISQEDQQKLLIAHNNDLKKLSDSDTEYITADEEPMDHYLYQFINDINFTSNLSPNGHIQIVGEVQLGKCQSLIDLALYKIITNHNVLILLNPLKKDILQLKNRLQEELLDYFIFIEKPNKIFEEVLLNKNSFKIYVMMARVDYITSFNQSFSPSRSLYTIIDESDLFNHDKEQCENNTLNQRSNAILETIRLSKFNFCGITATPYAHTYIKEKYPITADKMYYIPISEDYVGFNSDVFIKNEIDSLYLAKPSNKWSLNQEKLLIDILTYEEHMTNSAIKKPITLINLSSSISQHDYIRDVIQKYKPDITFIIINQSEIRVSGKIYLITKTKTLQEVLYIIQTKLRVVKHIVIIGCCQINRGTSIRSEVPNYKSINDIIYATSYIYDCSNNKTTDEIFQSVNRICGIFKGYRNNPNFKLRLYTTEKIIEHVSQQIKKDHNTRLENQKRSSKGHFVDEIMPCSKDPSNYKILSKVRGRTLKLNTCISYHDGSMIYPQTESTYLLKKQEIVRGDLSNFQHIKNMLPKWLDPNNTTNISIFIKKCIRYINQDITDIYMERIDTEDTLKFCQTNHRDKRHGKIFQKVSQGYVFTDDFKRAYESYKTY